ncbi:MAG: carboxypeptidase-like regulatory domain-containing protein [Acidobacteria bacterium]|nr:carboxypeptidase-like regulatory domain-containing protein [Acidobacteriota bacterium]
MKVRSLVFLLALLLTVVLWPNPELTASTYYNPPVCEAFNLAKAVFIGRVVTANQKREYVYDDDTDEPSVACSLEVVFEVIEPFSGALGRTMNVWESGGETCEGVDFTLGEVYLVYAYEEDEDKKLWAGLRTRSLKPISISASDAQWKKESRLELQKEYDEEFEFLRSVSRKTQSGARIYGAARSFQRLLGKNDKGRDDTLTGVMIKIESERQSLEVKTDSDGKFDVLGLEPGIYKVTAVSPEGFVPFRFFQWRDHPKSWNKEFSLRDCGCAQLIFMFDLSPSTQVDGRVVDAEGKPLAGVEISLISEKWREEKEIKDDDIKSFQTRSAKTDGEGKYKIIKVEPGRYLLGVNVTRPTPQSPHQRIFYPDVSDIKQAEVITVEPGKTTGLFDLRLTHTLEKCTIQGIVVWPDDTPVVGANISLRHPEEGVRRGYEATTDDQGRFALKELKDYEYEIQVYWRNNDEKASDEINKSPLEWRSATSEAEKLKVTDNVKDLKIVLSKQW